MYRWRTDQAIHRLAVNFAGEPTLPAPGSSEEFLVARHWGYLARHANLTREYRLDHPPWRVWSSAEARLTPGAGPLFGDRFSHALAATGQRAGGRGLAHGGASPGHASRLSRRPRRPSSLRHRHRRARIVAR